jgi:hypothetical protein
VIAHNTGAFVEIPDFLDSHHDITNTSDVDSYLARLEASALDDENARLAHDSAAGVQLPDFLLDKVIHQLTVARQIPIADWRIVAGFVKRAQAYRKDPGVGGCKDRGVEGCAGNGTADRGDETSTRARELRCRRLEDAGGRCVLRVDPAGGHYH